MNLSVILEEYKTSQYQIYCDMDGVITAFSERYEHFTGKTPTEMDQDLIQQYGYNKAKIIFWEKVDPIGPKFWSKMSKTKDANELLEFILPYKPILLSSPSKSQTSTEGKKQWVKENLPKSKLILRQAKDKCEFASSNNILIDDRADTCESWRAKGGIAIVHKSAIDTIKQLEKLGFKNQVNEIKVQGNKVTPEEIRELWNMAHNLASDNLFRSTQFLKDWYSAREIDGLSWLQTLPQHKLNQYRIELEDLIKKSKNLTEIKVTSKPKLQVGQIYRYQDYGDDMWKNNYKFIGVNKDNKYEFQDLESPFDYTSNTCLFDEDLIRDLFKDKRIERQPKGPSNNAMGDLIYEIKVRGSKTPNFMEEKEEASTIGHVVHEISKEKVEKWLLINNRVFNINKTKLFNNEIENEIIEHIFGPRENWNYFNQHNDWQWETKDLNKSNEIFYDWLLKNTHKTSIQEIKVGGNKLDEKVGELWLKVWEQGHSREDIFNALENTKLIKNWRQYSGNEESGIIWLKTQSLPLLQQYYKELLEIDKYA